VLNAFISKVCIAQAAGISSRKMNLTSTTETSRFTVETFEESVDGSAFIFMRWFKLAHISVGLCKLRVPTKVTNKQISQANYFYWTSISRRLPLRIHSTEILFI